MIVKELVARLGLDIDGKGFEKAETLIGGLKKGLEGVALGIVAVGGAVMEMARETANAGVDAYKLSVRMGTTADAAQELAYAARAVGGDVQSLETAMFHMSRTIETARQGSTEAQQAFSGLGVSLHDLIHMKPDEQFTRLAGGLAKVRDQGMRAQKAQAIFGRGVVELLPLLDRGEEGIRAFREEAHEMGLVLSEEVIADSREFKQTIRQVSDFFEGLKLRVGEFVLHGLVKMTRAVKSVALAFKDWIGAHPDRALNVLKLGLTAVVALTGKWLALTAIASAEAVAGFIAVGVSALAAGAEAAVAFAVAAAPALALAAAIGLVLLGLEDVYHFFKGDKKTLIGDTIDYWKREFRDIRDFVKAIVSWLGSKLVPDMDEWMDRVHDTGPIQRKASPGVQRRIQEAIGPPLSVEPAMSAASGTFPRYSTPMIAAPMSPVAGPGSTFQANFTINTHPGMDENAVASKVNNTLDSWHRSKVREARAAEE